MIVYEFIIDSNYKIFPIFHKEKPIQVTEWAFICAQINTQKSSRLKSNRDEAAKTPLLFIHRVHLQKWLKVLLLNPEVLNRYLSRASPH